MTSFTLSGGGSEDYQVDFNIINDNIPESPTTENFTASIAVFSSNVPLTLAPQMAFVAIVDDDGMYLTTTLFYQKNFFMMTCNIYMYMCVTTSVCLLYTAESVIGFEDSMYIVREEDGFVELCVAILEPQDLTLLNSTYAASIDITTLENGTATGEV